MTPSKQITFDDFTLNAADEWLMKGPEKIHLRPKSFALLKHLVANCGKLVTKDQLMNILWQDCNVGDEALKHCVAEIRRALGDRSETPRYIETVHRRGYRFIGTPSEQRKDAELPEAETREAQAPVAIDRLFVGRERELSQLRQHLEKAKGGVRQTLFISGEQGIGKTALIDAFLDEAAPRVFTRRSWNPSRPWTARGHCIQSHGSTEAYMPLLEALTGLCRLPEHRRIAAVLRRHAPLWIAQMPSLAIRSRMKDIQRQVRDATRERMLRELAEAFEELTSDRLLILALEDIHWSDPSTLDWISYWAQRRGPSRMMLIATCRPAESTADGHPFKNIRRELDARQLCHEISLPFLDEPAIGEYLSRRFPAHSFPAGIVPWIEQRTSGNPLFIANILDCLTGQGFIVHRNNGWILDTTLENIELTAPPTIQQIVDRQFEQCTPGEQRLLQAGSVNGMEFSVAAVAAILGEEADEIELLCRGLAGKNRFLKPVSPGAVPGKGDEACFRFIHEFYRNICHQQIPSEQRARFHRRASEFIERAVERPR